MFSESAAISTQDLIHGILLTTAFLFLVGIAELLRWRMKWTIESTRKLVHSGGGLICILFPSLIDSHWVVLVLAVSMATLFVVTRKLGLLNSVHGIARKSRGTEYYPIVIYLLFLISADQPWKYVICILVLATADAAAAIVGTKFGRIHYRVEDETKSLEGSLAFLGVTLVVVLVPLLLACPMYMELHSPYAHYVLAATLIGLLVACFEAVSGKGRDNLFVPLGTYLVLSKTFKTDVSDLIAQNISFVAMLVVLVGLSLQSRSFQTGAAVMICLASYGCWAMGSFDWALPVFIGFGFYLVAASTVELPWRLSIRPVFYNLIIPFLILVGANLSANQSHPEWAQMCFGPFLAGACVALSQATLNAVNWARRTSDGRIEMATLSGFACFFLLVLPSAIRLEQHHLLTLAMFLAVVVVSSIVSANWLPPRPPVDASAGWLYGRVAITTVASLTIAGFQFADVCQVWEIPVW